MQMAQAYEFRAHFPLCALDFGQEPMGGGGSQGMANSADKRQYPMPDIQRMPLYICGPVILLLSLGGYAAGYEILTALIGFFSEP